MQKKAIMPTQKHASKKFQNFYMVQNIQIEYVGAYFGWNYMFPSKFDFEYENKNGSMAEQKIPSSFM